MSYWGNNPYWQNLPPAERAAALAQMEANSGDTAGAKNALGAIINRSGMEGQDLGAATASPGNKYQPLNEDAQYARLSKILNSPQHQELTALAQSRLSGQTPDWAGGATHFLAKPDVMLSLEDQNPNKYRSWRGWTGYDPKTNSYANEVPLNDASHSFLAPNGPYSAVFKDGQSAGSAAAPAIATASNTPPTGPASAGAPAASDVAAITTPAPSPAMAPAQPAPQTAQAPLGLASPSQQASNGALINPSKIVGPIGDALGIGSQTQGDISGFLSGMGNQSGGSGGGTPAWMARAQQAPAAPMAMDNSSPQIDIKALLAALQSRPTLGIS